MKIKNYCIKSGRSFFYPDEQNSLWLVRYNQTNNQWILAVNGRQNGNHSWAELVEKIKHLPEIGQYL